MNLAFHWREHATIAGIYQRHAVRIEGVAASRADLLDDTLQATIDAAQPELIVHAAGLTNVDACERDPAQAARIHIAGTQRIAEICRRHRIGLLHISTDHLFVGDQSFVSEETAPQPLNAYARTKLEGENAAREILPEAVIVRTNFFGWGAPHRTSFSDWVLAVLREKRAQAMFTDVYFTPILIQDLADRLLQLAALGQPGIYHLCGAERVSKMQFAQMLAEVFELSAENLQPASVRESSLAAPRPRDMSLDCRKAEQALGEPMPALIPAFRRLRALEAQGLPDLLKSAAVNA